jgi:hypothetical protein
MVGIGDEADKERGHLVDVAYGVVSLPSKSQKLAGHFVVRDGVSIHVEGFPLAEGKARVPTAQRAAG